MELFTMLAEAGSDGSAFLGFLIIFGFLYAIYKALTKKKSYDVHMRGRVIER